MTNVVILSSAATADRLTHRPPPFLVFFATSDGRREGHHQLAVHAVAAGWDESMIVVQDDVTLPERLPAHRGDITSYHRRSHTGHVCPRAFSATPTGWRRLADAWGRPGKTCELWEPDWCGDDYLG